MMRTWAQVILYILKLVTWAIRFGEQQMWLNEGEQRQIAKGVIEVARKHDVTRKTLEDIRNLSDAQLDDELRKLEPNSGG